MKLLLMLFLSLVAAASFGQTKQMAVTVDDLPTVVYSKETPDFHMGIAQQLIDTFERYDIPAIGYVNEGKLYTNGTLDSSQVDILELWVANGYELGNHTFSHASYHRLPFQQYSAEVLNGAKYSRMLSDKYNRSFTYFRHPFLHIGTSKKKADSLSRFLNKQGYIEAPVTIDNEDYIFAKAYHIAYSKGDNALMGKIGKAYVSYMVDKVKYFEWASKQLFDRNIAQTLLIHANLLNAHCLDDLAEAYQELGYEFISQSKVLEDEAYQEPITKYGSWGISWIDRWALSRGKKGDFFEKDPRTPEFVKALAQ
ncbi:MAG: polysaccharide deacetylase-like protein [Balneolaceae bacterium]|nr:polysaccharide deacetylase-like protein [Balneolaceae bacterium]